MVKLHDVREFITNSLTDVNWEELIEVDIEDINNKEFFVTYSEYQNIPSNPICKNKYKITIELCEE